jgi:hypothetical protein
MVKNYGEEFNIAPRKQFYGSHYGINSQLCRVTLIDTDLEKDIELGVNYPYGKLE